MKKSETLLKTIQEKIQLGNTLTSICRSKEMPNLSTIYKWMNQDQQLKERILEARRIGAMTWLDNMQDLLDQDIEPQKVSWARERLFHSRWMASKLVGVFNDKLIQENTGEPLIVIKWDDGLSEHKGEALAHTLKGTNTQEIKEKPGNDKKLDSKLIN